MVSFFFLISTRILSGLFFHSMHTISSVPSILPDFLTHIVEYLCVEEKRKRYEVLVGKLKVVMWMITE